jgi:hypothetical protein
LQAVGVGAGCEAGEQVAEQVLFLRAECFEQFGFGVVAGVGYAGLGPLSGCGGFGDAGSAVVGVEAADDQPADFEPVQQRRQGGFVHPERVRRGPNVVYIVLDDAGNSALSSYGDPIETPNIDRIAVEGVRYTLCSPTWSCLLTGRNHTRNSMACIPEAAVGLPNPSGTIPPENGMLPEILGERGWNTRHGREVAPVPGHRDERGVDAAELAEGESAGTGSWARRPTSGTRTWSTTTRWTSPGRRRRAITSPRT